MMKEHSKAIFMGQEQSIHLEKQARKGIMANKNTSDSIEAYIKALLAQAGVAELKRVS